MTEMCSTCSSGQAGARDTIIKDDVENWFRHKETWGIKECKKSSCRQNWTLWSLGIPEGHFDSIQLMPHGFLLESNVVRYVFFNISSLYLFSKLHCNLLRIRIILQIL